MSSQASGFIARCLSLTGTELSLGNPAPIDTSDPVWPLDYTEWLQDWTRLNKPSSTDIIVPLEAQHIATPLLPLEWGHLLATHPNRKLVAFFLQGLTEGFRIGYDYTSNTLKPAKTNMESALSHTAVVEDYIHKELTLSRMAGPFLQGNIQGGQVSRFGVIPKHHQIDSWRLIVDLSHPPGFSVNDGIPKDLCSLHYVTIDDAIKQITKLGSGTLLAKADIKSAFRLLPVHPADRHLLQMAWNGSIYVDTCLPFGLRSAPKIFNILADLLQWCLQQQGVSHVMHYLDDFLMLGPPSSNQCHQNLDIFKQTCQKLGVPLAIEKVEGPSTSLTFLGITLDTAKMEIRLPDEKLARIRQSIDQWLPKKKATKREILSLVGLLQHATKVVRCGRTFVSRMYSTAAKLKKLDFYTRLNKEFRSDLWWWHTFLVSWNGLSLLQCLTVHPTPHYLIQTDASGTWGCGAYFQGQWFQLRWDSQWQPCSIMAKELVPIVLSTAIWGPQLARHRVLYQCDNLGVVSALHKGSAKDPIVMNLLRCLWFFIAHYDIDLTCEHIAGSQNNTADDLSRCNMQSFFSQNPSASQRPSPLPASLLAITGASGPDWTSPNFRELFSRIINKD